jgi:hypothetical protein
MADPNMQIALAFSRGLSQDRLELPGPLSGVDVRAQLVDKADRPIWVDGDGNPSFEVLGGHLRHVVRHTEALLPDVDPLDRATIALRLWAGCLMAAKVIALETRSGPNTSTLRGELFAWIDQIAAEDPIYRAGVEAAPAFKRRRQQEFELDGVPEDSAVRRFA